MIRKIEHYFLSTALTILASVFMLPLFFFIALGVIAGLIVEIFKFYSRISVRELRGYKISKRIEKDIFVLKTNKVFKLPLPEKVRGKGVFMAPMSEKKLSEVH
jgi:hypothetical protein